MAPPLRRQCQWPDCSLGEEDGAYQTVEGLATHELVMRDLELHMLIHTVGVTAVTGNKVVKLKRPKIKDQCTDTNWELFLKKWARYN